MINNNPFNNYYFDPKNGFQIYCDMDGVLCDFWNQFLKFTDYKYTIQEYEELYGYNGAKLIVREWGEEFWSTMEWMKDGKLLWNYIKKYNPIILTAPYEFESCYEGKKKWIIDHLGIGIYYVITKDKEQYANKTSILIDDFHKNILPFERNGGHGILHTSALETIEILKNKHNL